MKQLAGFSFDPSTLAQAVARDAARNAPHPANLIPLSAVLPKAAGCWDSVDAEAETRRAESEYSHSDEAHK